MHLTEYYFAWKEARTIVGWMYGYPLKWDATGKCRREYIAWHECKEKTAELVFADAFHYGSGACYIDNNGCVRHVPFREWVEGAGMTDPVNHPEHYTSHPSGVECIQITRHMGFNLGNAFKYIWRADLKGNQVQDLEKAIWYIKDEIDRLQASTRR